MSSVLVTGASRGIGLAITRHFAERGWEVYATARTDADLRTLGELPGVHPVRLDITDREALAELPRNLPPQLDAVVNNAGIIVQGPVETVPLDTLSRQLDVNVTAQVGVVQAVLPLLRRSRGRIVFMSSVSGLITVPGTGAYSASKYALESIADALRMELRPWGIRVSLVEPGPTRTDMWGDALDDYDQMVAGLTPEHRELYARQLDGNRTLVRRTQKLVSDPATVVAAVDRALTSRRPRARYRCDQVSRAQVALAAVAPTAATDALFSALTTTRSARSTLPVP